MQWRIVSWNRRESEPRRFFIRISTTQGQKKVRLFEYDETPNGYHSVAYCTGMRQAKQVAEELCNTLTSPK
jgi:hypothetical protein